ncbi:MAG TPA: cell division protein ZapA [Puia sp.]|nr:cell division protein ZapA [Puia sp.]
MQELIPINVLIGDRTYRIKIEKQEEEMVRKTLKTINDKILEFKTNFAGKDIQDYIAMVLLWFATQQTSEEHNSSSSDIDEIIKKIESQLEKAL